MSQGDFMLDEPVVMIDRLLVKPGAQDALLRAYYDTYIPLTQRRMRLVNLTILPPFPRPFESTEILVQWEYSSLNAFWAARMEEEFDAGLSEFWAGIADLIEGRSRLLGRSDMMAMCGPLEDLPSEIHVPAGFNRVIAFGKIDAAALGNAERISPFQVRGGINRGGYTGRENELTIDLLVRQNQDLQEIFPGADQFDEVVVLGPRIASGFRAPEIRQGVKRSVLFKTMDGASPKAIAKMETELANFGRHVREIRNWSISTIAKCHGDTPWTHCFEQEFADIADISGAYLNHPFHWSVIDRFFHREAPEQVADQFFHSIYSIDRPVLSALSGDRV